MAIKKTTEEFIKDAIDVHGDAYDYSMVNYINARTKIDIQCPNHGVFQQTPHNHLHGQGCKLCGIQSRTNKRSYTTEWFIHNARKIHGNKYDYSDVEYINSNTKVKISCPIHGIFKQYPNNHIDKSCGCAKCRDVSNGIKKLHSNDAFINAAKGIHGDRYRYNKVDFNGYNGNNVTITCVIHGDFIQSPHAHIYSKCGCPKCSKGNYSKISIHWLESFDNPHIQHAENGGEYRIDLDDKKHFRVDGYDQTTNTVYEFLGDRYHGNLDVFKSHEKCHPFSDKTAKKLNNEWLYRKSILEEMGYNVIFIWENDYKVVY